MTRPERDRGFSHVLIGLLRGVLYRETDPSVWQALLDLQARVRDHVAPMGLELTVDEAEGYAWLRQRATVDGEAELPKLVPRRPLGFQLSLLLVLLRKRLAETDATGGETRVVLSRDEIVDLVRLFATDTANEAKLVDRVDTQINKVIELGFLRRLRPTGERTSRDSSEERYEVRRILKAFVDAQFLAELDRRLTEYRAHLAGPDDEGGA